MKKKILSILLISCMLFSLSACKDNAAGNVEKVDYDAKAVAAKYNLPEIPAADKNLKIQMGYNNCDHMVAAIVGEKAGIYEALGLNVTVTKTNNTNIAQAMTTGEMHVGYMGIEGALNARNEGAPIIKSIADSFGSEN